MRCLHCGKRLSLIRKLAGSEFCSDQHRRQYRDEQETLGLARLIEANTKSDKESKKEKKTRKRKGVPAQDSVVLAPFFFEPPSAISVLRLCTQSLDAIIPALSLSPPSLDLRPDQESSVEEPVESLVAPAPPTESVTPIEPTPEPEAPKQEVVESRAPMPTPAPMLLDEVPPVAGFVPLSVEPLATQALVHRDDWLPKSAVSPMAPGREVVLEVGCAFAPPFVSPLLVGSIAATPPAANFVEQFSPQPGLPGILNPGRPNLLRAEGLGIQDAELPPISLADSGLPGSLPQWFEAQVEPEVPPTTTRPKSPVLFPDSEIAPTELPFAEALGLSSAPSPAAHRSQAPPSLPGAIQFVVRFRPKLTEAVPVTIGCAEAAAEIAREAPVPERCAAFLLPPPDLSLEQPTVKAAPGIAELAPLSYCQSEGHPAESMQPEPYRPEPPRMPQEDKAPQAGELPFAPQTDSPLPDLAVTESMRPVQPVAQAPASHAPRLPEPLAELSHAWPSSLPAVQTSGKVASGTGESAPSAAAGPIAQHETNIDLPAAAQPSPPSPAHLLQSAVPVEVAAGVSAISAGGTSSEVPAPVPPAAISEVAAPSAAEAGATGLVGGSGPAETLGRALDETASSPPPVEPEFQTEQQPETGVVLPDGGSISSTEQNFTEAAEPARPGLLRMSLGQIVPRNAATQHQTSLKPRPMAPKPLAPPLRLEVVPERRPSRTAEREKDPIWTRTWGPIAKRSRNLRGSMKWIGAIMAVTIAFLLRSPDAPAPALTATEESDSGFTLAVANQWQSFQDDISGRAAVSLTDDFRSGLGNWEGGSDWARSWSYDAAGFIRPGRMALYTPTLALSDYTMSFSGYIDSVGLSWMIRATDEKNHYVVRLVIVENGPLPRGAIIRYPVVDGKRGKPNRTDLPFTLRNQQMHQLRTEVRGDRFTVHVDGQLVDYWNEPRLPHGGVGFFQYRGERNRLRWVSVTHQYDLLGRLCALLAPYNLDNAPRRIER